MVRTITDALYADPVWSYAFNDPSLRAWQYGEWWGLLINSALRYDASWVADDCAAVAVWIPPGGIELTDEEEALVAPLMRRIAGDRADLILTSLELFDQVHPHSQPHYYLSLLGTRSDRRGEGLGMGLLRHCLDQIDAEHAPAYLESSNPANHHRYEGVGFVRNVEFEMPGGGPVVTTMWRPSF